MTNKEYIKILQNLQDWLYLCSMNGGTKLEREAIDKAIEVLSQPEQSEEDRRLLKKLRSFHNGSYAKVIDRLMSAQPELIHCGECKHYVFIDDRIDRFPIRGCSLTGFNDVDADDFCSKAERREATT